MSRKRVRSTRRGRRGSRRACSSPPSPYGALGAGEGIAYFEDNPDDVRLTVTAKGPAGQLRFLLNASDLTGGIRGIAIEESDLSVEVTPRETVELIRQRHSAC